MGPARKGRPHRITGAQRWFLLYRPQKPVQCHLHVFLPRERGAQLQPQPRIRGVVPDRLEAHGKKMVRGKQAGGLFPASVTEGLDGLETPPQQILGDRLHHHPAQALSLIARHDERRHQLDSVRRDRTRGKRRRARNVRRRGVEDETDRDVVDVDDSTARSPVEEDGGDPGFLLQSGCSRFYRGFSADGVQLPEDTRAATPGEVRKVVQRERYEPTPHEG